MLRLPSSLPQGRPTLLATGQENTWSPSQAKLPLFNLLSTLYSPTFLLAISYLFHFLLSSGPLLRLLPSPSSAAFPPSGHRRSSKSLVSGGDCTVDYHGLFHWDDPAQRPESWCWSVVPRLRVVCKVKVRGPWENNGVLKNGGWTWRWLGVLRLKPFHLPEQSVYLALISLHFFYSIKRSFLNLKSSKAFN